MHRDEIKTFPPFLIPVRNTAHRKCIDRIMAWNHEDTDSIRHDDVLTLTNNTESSFRQSFESAMLQANLPLILRAVFATRH